MTVSDERLERELRDLLREDAPASAPASLRVHAADVARRGRPDGRLGLRIVRGLAAAAVVVAVVASLALVAGQRGQQAASAPPPSAPPTPVASATSPPAPSATAAPVTSWTALVPDAPGTSTATTGPDGATYVATAPYGAGGQAKVYAFDASGAAVPGWPFAPAGVIAFGRPLVAADGTVFVFGASFDTNDAQLFALDPSGRVKDGWPYRAHAPVPFGGLLLNADGAPLFVEALPDGSQQVVSLTASGSVAPGWPVALPGGWPCFDGGSCAAVAADGTWYGLVGPGGGPGDAEIVALRPDGSAVPGWPVRIAGGEGFLLGPDDGVYAWGFDTRSAGSGIAVQIVRTRFALLGADGQTRDGWPVTIDGPAGVPAVAADGTLFTTTGSLGGPEQVVALGPDGRPAPGWPYALRASIAALPYAPSAGAPPRAVSPAVGADGTVVLPVVRAPSGGGVGLLVLSRDGRPAAGPAWLPPGARLGTAAGYEIGGGTIVSPVGAGGRVYVAATTGSQASILALQPGGEPSVVWTSPAAGEPATPTSLEPVGDVGVRLVAQAEGGSATLVAFVVAP